MIPSDYRGEEYTQSDARSTRSMRRGPRSPGWSLRRIPLETTKIYLKIRLHSTTSATTVKRPGAQKENRKPIKVPVLPGLNRRAPLAGGACSFPIKIPKGINGRGPACGEVARLCPTPSSVLSLNLATVTQRHRALTDTNKVNTSTISPQRFYGPI